MDVLRTPDDRFTDLPGFPYEPLYTDIPVGPEGAPAEDSDQAIRIHHIDSGPEDGPIVLCLHGQPTWSYLYRHMIATFNENGIRVLAPDLVGFGRSDKPTRREDFSYNRQVDWMNAWLRKNDFRDLTHFGQDWGGLIGLRLVGENPERFDRVVVANTGLPLPVDVSEDVVAKVKRFRSPETPTPSMMEMMQAIGSLGPDDFQLSFANWQKWTWETEDLPIGQVVAASVAGGGTPALSAEEIAAYDAPFPDPSYKMGPRAMPSLVPMFPDDPSVPRQAAAWKVLDAWDKPLLSVFTDNDPITGGMESVLRERVPGAQGQPHRVVEGGGHFLQEGRGREVAQIVSEWMLG